MELRHRRLDLVPYLVQQRHQWQDGGRLLYLDSQLINADEDIRAKEARRHHGRAHDCTTSSME